MQMNKNPLQKPSNTPLTDAQAFPLHGRYVRGDGVTISAPEAVDANFARKLERELAARVVGRPLCDCKPGECWNRDQNPMLGRHEGQCYAELGQGRDDAPVVQRLGADFEADKAWLLRQLAETNGLEEPMACGGVLPSCLCCGQLGKAKAWLIDHPEVYVCERCHSAAHAPKMGTRTCIFRADGRCIDAEGCARVDGCLDGHQSGPRMATEASWTTTGKNCPIGGVCQDSGCWKLGEKPCKRWNAGERRPPAPVQIGPGIFVAPSGVARQEPKP
jgi:hypothetical protein